MKKRKKEKGNKIKSWRIKDQIASRVWDQQEQGTKEKYSIN